MNILSFFFEATSAARKIENANQQTSAERAERLINAFCDDQNESKNNSVRYTQGTIV